MAALLPVSCSPSTAASPVDGVESANSRAPGQSPTESKEEEQGQDCDLETGGNLPRSQSIHKHIQPPRYVRSVPLGLQRANTNTINSPSKTASNNTNANSSSPVASNKVFRSRRISVPHPPNDGENIRPLPPRSESALGLVSSTSTSSEIASSSSDSPVKLRFSKSYNGHPPDRRTQSLLFEYGDTSQVSELPSDPKTWTPSQLSIYLSHMLRLTPKPVISDVMKFVVQRGLTGKRFLRLRNQDLIEMGININWCRVLSTARERLRRECLRGRIFGFTVQADNDTAKDTTITAEDGGAEEEDIESLFLKLPTSTSTTSLNQEWNKNSWRRNEGKKSRGRVKGIAQVFESGEVDELGVRRRNSVKSNAELDEVVRIRRSRQESTDSEMSTVSSRSFASYSKRMSLPIINLGSMHDKEDTIDTIKVAAPRREEASESESETEDAFGSPTAKVDWATVEPLALEETLEISESFFVDPPNVSSSSSSSSPSTPCASTFVQPVFPATTLEEAVISTSEVPVEDDKPETYQSRILSHGAEGYAAIRPRKQSDLSEVPDELSEEHLAYWNTMPDEEPYPRSPYSTLSRSMPRPSLSDLSPTAEQNKEDEPDTPSAMAFAETDENIITMKKHNPASISAAAVATTSKIAKQTQSVEDFGSLKLTSVQSRSASKGSTLLKDLFEENTPLEEGDMDTAARFGITKRKKDSRRLSDLFRGDDDSEQYYSLKSRSGSVMMLPRAEVEEMQARLKDLEKQLELAKSASASRASAHSPTGSTASAPHPFVEAGQEGRSKNEAMSAWVKGALGEAHTIARDGNQEPSWLGLGGWALAAGLGIGIVVGEAVFSKLRR